MSLTSMMRTMPSATTNNTRVDRDGTSAATNSTTARGAPMENNNNNDDDNNNEIVSCRLLGILPFTHNGHTPDTHGLHRLTGLENNHTRPASMAASHMAAAVLAVRDFNAGNAAVVPALADYRDTCNLRLEDPLFLNSNANAVTTTQSLVQLTAAYSSLSSQPFCGIVGPYFNAQTDDVATWAVGLGVPLVSHHATDIFLTGAARSQQQQQPDSSSSPRIVLASLDLFATSRALLSWLRFTNRTDFVTVVHVSEAPGEEFVQAFEKAVAAEQKLGSEQPAFASGNDVGGTGTTTTTTALFENVEVLSVGFDRDFVDGGEDFKADPLPIVLGRVQELGYRNVILALTSIEQLEWVAEEISLQGINVGDYVWMLAPPWSQEEEGTRAVVAERAAQKPVLRQLVQGMAVVAPLDGFTHRGREDAFLQAWRQQDADFVAKVNTQHPIQYPTQPGYEQLPPTYFQQHDPAPGSAFMYDAVMLQAVGLCRRQQLDDEERRRAAQSNVLELKRGEKQNDTSFQPPPRRRRRNAHVDAIVSLEWEAAATGGVRFRGRPGFPGSRDINGVTFGVYNFRNLTAEDAARAPNQTTWFYLTDVWTSNASFNDGTWTPVPGAAPFLYANGTPLPPALNVTPGEQNFLSSHIRILGLSFGALAIAISCLGLIYVTVQRREPFMVRSQPPFLKLMLLGCLLLSVAIIMFSFDENQGWDERMLSKACASTVWLVSLGYNAIYAALACKMWRVHVVLQPRRHTVVTVRRAMVPFVVSVLCHMIVLLVWTFIHPFEWRRRQINDETREEFGRCISSNSTAYVTTLAGIMAVTTLVCGIMAWKTKDIDSDLSESSWVFSTIFVHAQVLLLGIPILVILDTASADATYMGRTIILFSLAVTTILFTMGPKVYNGYVEAQERSVAASSVGAERDDSTAHHSLTQIPSPTSSPPRSPKHCSKRGSCLGQTHISGLNLMQHVDSVPSLNSSPRSQNKCSKRGSCLGQTHISGLNLMQHVDSVPSVNSSPRSQNKCSKRGSCLGQTHISGLNLMHHVDSVPSLNSSPRSQNKCSKRGSCLNQTHISGLNLMHHVDSVPSLNSSPRSQNKCSKRGSCLNQTHISGLNVMHPAHNLPPSPARTQRNMCPRCGGGGVHQLSSQQRIVSSADLAQLVAAGGIVSHTTTFRPSSLQMGRNIPPPPPLNDDDEDHDNAGTPARIPPEKGIVRSAASDRTLNTATTITTTTSRTPSTGAAPEDADEERSSAVEMTENPARSAKKPKGVVDDAEEQGADEVKTENLTAIDGAGSQKKKREEGAVVGYAVGEETTLHSVGGASGNDTSSPITTTNNDIASTRNFLARLPRASSLLRSFQQTRGQDEGNGDLPTTTARTTRTTEQPFVMRSFHAGRPWWGGGSGDFPVVVTVGNVTPTEEGQESTPVEGASRSISYGGDQQVARTTVSTVSTVSIATGTVTQEGQQPPRRPKTPPNAEQQHRYSGSSLFVSSVAQGPEDTELGRTISMKEQPINNPTTTKGDANLAETFSKKNDNMAPATAAPAVAPVLSSARGVETPPKRRQPSFSLPPSWNPLGPRRSNSNSSSDSSSLGDGPLQSPILLDPASLFHFVRGGGDRSGSGRASSSGSGGGGSREGQNIPPSHHRRRRREGSFGHSTQTANVRNGAGVATAATIVAAAAEDEGSSELL